MFNGMMMSGADSVIPPVDPPAEDVVTVTGGSGFLFEASNTGANAEVFLKFTSDGDVFVKKNSGSYTQRASTTDWVVPATNAPGLYEIRFTNASGDTTYLSSTQAVDVWEDFSATDYILSIFDSSPNFGGKSATFTIEIRLDGGAVLGSGEYTISADREDT